jgi:hypothetical protein
MVKPLRKGRCPYCSQGVRRHRERMPSGMWELAQPLCVQCCGRRYRYGPSWYLGWPKAGQKVGRNPLGTWEREEVPGSLTGPGRKVG